MVRGIEKRLVVLQYLVKAQVVLDGVRGVEDGPAGGDNQDKAVESLWVKQSEHTDSQKRHYLSLCMRKVHLCQ